ncbi:DarT ssDNA thymidine ADP-ribosyltransferase family protein [Vibrio vulnificus]|uniref:DarT ssDNA thymidine ADP-ribosyltransferase family protein n=1 Tax=Vibrio TaxID=662 RepID=UPI00237C8E6D|nr:DarT ssDNA thymidine ADP-ribosyltransferase family protein [Vibrio aestuarianus]MDE1233272.1 DUF4433 domain-containing protein [Vibrio aestuarianus]HDY7709000.1 DUF4433 domain-containing protein [Vibrio vulnificus]HDY7908922.1 DUF4433 domain-containing protein [Vibrio vulnificus]
MEKEQIKNVIAERKIPYLVHFTNLKNLKSIFSDGLVPRSQLDALDAEYESNDDARLDGHEDSVSLSVAFPNCQMFYKLWKNSGDKFCLLALDPELLQKHSSAFCKYNAADGAISSQDIETLKTAAAFEGMFDELPSQRSRADQKLEDYDPTDVQAEILVFDTIPKGYIGAVVFPDKESEKDFKDIIGGCKSYVHSPNKGFYGTRTFSREY